jgi:hypothetical protein
MSGRFAVARLFRGGSGACGGEEIPASKEAGYSSRVSRSTGRSALHRQREGVAAAEAERGDAAMHIAPLHFIEQ